MNDAMVIDFPSRRFLVNGISVFLRNKEFTLLCYLMDNAGRVLTRTQLLEDVWDRNICCCTNTVDVHVSSLRRILKKYLGKDYIRTVHCVGYVFDLDDSY